MRNRQILFLFILISLTFKISAQTNTDKIEIYRLILQDYLDTIASYKELFPICLLDSTCTADYPKKMCDSIYEKYLSIDKYDYIGKSKLADTILSSSKRHELLPNELLQDKRIFKIKTDDYYKIFEFCCSKKKPIEKCWTRFYKKFKTNGYCRLSSPYFYNSKVAFIYFYYLYGPLAGSGYTFLVIKENNIWHIKTRIWQWLS